ncbi:hypothetical protein GWI33_010590 [Rhynchophorus ferrugineus]|uniref:Uncharacterized protein n=1 Tax=Rhynchophorus ferrugineus TaxID=354439 RepID=A0A834J1T5_RHYFE|nr:hypothetical protein GWI33_010590 [Rhynchophorus ferrugineus]
MWPDEHQKGKHIDREESRDTPGETNCFVGYTSREGYVIHAIREEIMESLTQRLRKFKEQELRIGPARSSTKFSNILGAKEASLLKKGKLKIGFAKFEVEKRIYSQGEGLIPHKDKRRNRGNREEENGIDTEAYIEARKESKKAIEKTVRQMHERASVCNWRAMFGARLIG